MGRKIMRKMLATPVKILGWEWGRVAWDKQEQSGHSGRGGEEPRFTHSLGRQ